MRKVEMTQRSVRREAIPLGENRLQEGVQPFRAGHRFLQLRKKLAGIHLS
jgi:hypothetical protein